MSRVQQQFGLISTSYFFLANMRGGRGWPPFISYFPGDKNGIVMRGDYNLYLRYRL